MLKLIQQFIYGCSVASLLFCPFSFANVPLIPHEQPVEIVPETALLTIDQASEIKPTATIQLGTGIEGKINHAILTKNWQTLEQLLKQYRQQPVYDGILYDYALGTWYYAQKRYTNAITLYERVLTHYPNAHVLRFDLAIMQFENKQYQQAKHNLLAIKTTLSPELQAIAERYLTNIQQAQAIQPAFTLNYEQNNNVNNASEIKEIQWLGRTWVKSEESLPQKAHGVRYGAGATKTTNLQGNHFFTTMLDVSGIHYWDKDDYNEQQVYTSIGYQYQDFHQRFSISPFFDYTWLDEDAYQHTQGVSVGYFRRLNPTWRLNNTIRYSDKDFISKPLAERYNSQTFAHHLSVSYLYQPNMIFFSGVDYSDERAKDDEVSSVRYGVNVGMLAETEQGFAGQLSLRYAKRNFKAPESLVYHIKRKDDEYYLHSQFWHHKFQYKGFVPQLNLRYNVIDSNMDGFYSRENTHIFLSIDKKF